MINKAMAIGLVSLLCGCASWRFKPDGNHDAERKLPEAYAADGTVAAAEKWWTELKSDELNRLIAKALESNLSLAQARARLRQAGSAAGIAASARAPQLNAEFGTTHGRERTRRSDDAYDERKVENYSIGVVGSYELDLWGRVAAAEATAEQGYRASRWDFEAAAMSIAAETTLKWLELAYLRHTLTLVQGQVDTNKKLLELTELRFRRSMATALDVLQRRRALALTESLIPQVKADAAAAQHQLALLIGKPATGAPEVMTGELPTITALPELGLPSELLEKRPDVKSAWARLASAEWSVAAAKADRLPSIRLTGSWKTSSPDVDQLFRNWLGTLAASLIGPLIDGGRRKAEVERAKAVVDERLAAYRETVLIAFKEVADALALEAHQTDYLAALDKRLKATSATQREAQARYLKGQENYLPVLQATIDLQSLQRDLVRATFQRLSYRIQLHRALGGAWTQSLGDGTDQTTDNSKQE